MKAIQFDYCGEPAEVLQVRDIPCQCPVATRCVYGWSPVPSTLPIFCSCAASTGGNQGYRPLRGLKAWAWWRQSVRDCWRDVRRLTPGRRVAVPNSEGGNWQEQIVVSARQVVPIPDGVADEQGATFFVNPASALVMTHYVLKVPPGAWLLQTAAGSSLGRMVVRLGKRHGFKTINVVRRPDQADQLGQAGADAVIDSSRESIVDRVHQLTNGAGVPFALDAVSGTTGSAVVQSLAAGGRLLVYGTLAGEPLTVDSRVLMVGGKSIQGFWLTEWVKAQRITTLLGLFRRVSKLMCDGVLTTEVASRHKLDDIKTAVQQAVAPGRQGKVLLWMSDK